MVLKKAKRGASTGNTQRRVPGGMSWSIKANYITKKCHSIVAMQRNRSKNKHFGPIDDGEIPVSESIFDIPPIKYSLNKRKRWLVTEEAEERISNNFLENEMEKQLAGKSKKEKKKNRRKKGRKSENEVPVAEHEQPIRTVIINRVVASSSHICSSVYDSNNEIKPMCKGKNWRRSVKSMLKTQENIDVEYDIGNGSPSDSWPFQVQSNKHWEYVRSQKSKQKYSIRKTKTNKLWMDDKFDDLEDGYASDLSTASDEFQMSCVDESIEVAKGYGFSLGNYCIEKKAKEKKKMKKKSTAASNRENIQRELGPCNPASSDLVKFSPKNSMIFIMKQNLLENDHVDMKDAPLHASKDAPQNAGQKNNILQNSVTHSPVSDSRFKKDSKAGATSILLEQPIAPLESCEGFKVHVFTASISATKLQDMHGDAYIEGRSSPRKFALLLGKEKCQQQALVGGKCFLVAEELPSIKEEVTPLSLKIFHFQKCLEEALQPFLDYRDKVIDFQVIISVICSEKLTRPSTKEVTSHDNLNSHETVKKLSKWNTKCFHMGTAFDMFVDRIFKNHNTFDNESVNLDGFELVTPINQLCEICFDEIAGYQNEKPNSTELKPCLHSFCNSCWKKYLARKISANCNEISCPAHKCNSIIDVVTVVAIVTPELALKYMKSLFEYNLLQSSDWQWCPGCERAAFCSGFQDAKHKSVLQDMPTVCCPCKKDWCFSCQDNPHWPASCKSMQQMSEEKEKKIGNIFDKKGDIITTSVELKKCPFCRLPINKNSGCNHMVCRCGKSFCWNCLKPFGNNHYVNCLKVSVEVKVFSSLDVYWESKNSNFSRKVLHYRHQVEQVKKIKTKFGFDKRPNGFDSDNPNQSKVAILRKALVFQRDVCKLLEHIAITMFVSRSGTAETTGKVSKHFSRRVMNFFEKMDFLLSRIHDITDKKNLVQINFGELNNFVKKTEENLLRLKTLLS